MHAHVKSLLTIQRKVKGHKTCLFRRAGCREGARKVTGEFLPADAAHRAFRRMQWPVWGTASYPAKGPPILFQGNELTRLRWLGSFQQ